MELTLNELLKGKSTTIKNKNYFSTEKYITPFVEKMEPFSEKFVIKAMLPSQVTTNNGESDITYNKVWIQAVLPKEQEVEDHTEVIGMIYALDVRKPLVKFYRGYLNNACLNLTVFDPKWITVQELEPDSAIKYYTKELLELDSDFKPTLDYLKSTFLDRSEVISNLGTWVDNCLRKKINNKIHTVKLSPITVIDAYNSLFIDKDSDYYVPDSKEASLFDVYNAFTQQLTDDTKDIINIPDKTLLIKQILNIK